MNTNTSNSLRKVDADGTNPLVSESMASNRRSALRERLELQANLLLGELASLIKYFETSNGTPVAFEPKPTENGYGLARKWSAMGFEHEGVKLFEVERYEHHYGYSDSCGNHDERVHELIEISGATKLGKLTLHCKDVLLDRSFHLQQKLCTPIALATAQHLLEITESTQVSFNFASSSDADFSMKVGDISGSKAEELKVSLSSFVGVWKTIGERLKAQQLIKEKKDALKNEAQSIKDERAKLEHLKKVIGGHKRQEPS